MTIPTPDEICGRLRLDDDLHTRIYAADLIQQQQATIERLSAALEYAKKYLHGTHEFAALAEVQAIALGKDAK